MNVLEKLKLKIERLKEREQHLMAEIGGLLERNHRLKERYTKIAAMNQVLEARAKKGEQYLDDSIKLSNEVDDFKEKIINLEHQIRQLADEL